MSGIIGSRLLVIGAHPDDEVLGCGGTIATNAKKGGHTTVLIATEGSGAQNNYNPELMKRRHNQLMKCSEILGAQKVFHWDYPDMELETVPHLKLNAALQSFIQEGGYEYVFVHHPYDLNRDHQVLFRSVSVACRPTPGSTVNGLLAYHVNSSTDWSMASAAERFVPNVYIDISDFLEIKLKALAVYEEEAFDYPHPRSIEAVRDRARVFGSEVGLHAAEGYNLVFWREK